jgi:hypothetical protein
VPPQYSHADYSGAISWLNRGKGWPTERELEHPTMGRVAGIMGGVFGLAEMILGTRPEAVVVEGGVVMEEGRVRFLMVDVVEVYLEAYRGRGVARGWEARARMAVGMRARAAQRLGGGGNGGY